MKFLAQFDATVNPKPKVLIETCFDPTIKKAVDQFIAEILGLGEGEFLLKSLGGGPLPLAHPTITKSRCKVMVRQLRFAFHTFESLEELALIMHSPCAYYSQVPSQCHGHNKETRDLSLAGSLMKGALKEGKRVNLYFVERSDDKKKVSFYQAETPQHVITVPFDFLKEPIQQLA